MELIISICIFAIFMILKSFFPQIFGQNNSDSFIDGGDHFTHSDHSDGFDCFGGDCDCDGDGDD